MRVCVSLLLLAFLLSPALLLGQSTPSKPESFDYDHELAVADDAYNDGNYLDGAQHYQNAANIAEQLHMEPERVAAPLAGVAHSLLHQHKYSEAEPIFRQVLAIREKHPPEPRRMKRTFEGLADSLMKQNRFDEAEPYYLRALALYDRSKDEPSPDDEDCLHGHTLLGLGWIYFQRRAYDRAEVVDQQALEIWVNSQQKCALIVTAMEQLAILYRAQGKLDKAEGMYQRTLPMLQKELQEEEPELVAKQFDGLADIYFSQSKTELAAENYAKALSILHEINPQPQPILLTTLQRYAQALYKLKRTEEALKIQSQIDAIAEESAQASDPSVQLDGLLQKAAKAQSPPNLKEETALLVQATAIADKLTVRRDLRIGEAYRRLGSAYERQNQLLQAEAALRVALAADETAFGKDSPQLEQSLRGLATISYKEGKSDIAASLLQRELAIDEKSPVLNSANQVSTMSLLSMIYFGAKKYDKAEAILQSELKLLAANPEPMFLSTTLSQLAANYEADRKYDLAEKYYRQTLAVEQEKFGPQNPILMGPLWSLKELMIKMNRPDEAASFEARRQQIEQMQQLQLQKASSSSKASNQ